MVTNYRIIQINKIYFIQKKRLWWWPYITQVDSISNGEGLDIVSPIKFDTFTLAEEFVKKKTVNKHEFYIIKNLHYR